MKRVWAFLAIAYQLSLSADWGPPINIYTENPTGVPAVGIDSQGNAVIGYSWLHFMDANVGATQLVNGAPINTVGFPVALFTAAPVNTLNIAVNADGNATLIWPEFQGSFSAYYLRSSSLLNGVWSSPTDLTDPSVENVQTNAPPGITIDDANGSVGIWVPNDTIIFDTNVSYDLYSSGVWAGETALTMPSSDFIASAFVSGSPSGHAFALWANTGLAQLQGAYFNGLSWAVNLNISNDMNPSCTAPVGVSMNSSNNALIVWNNLSQGGLTSTLFSGGSYGTDQSVYVPSGGETLQHLAVGLDDSGDGAAIWIASDGGTFISTLYFASYISGSWGSPIILDQLMGNLAGLFYPNIGLDGSGNAVLAWQRSNQDTTTAVMASYMPKGAISAQVPILLSTDTTDGQAPDLAVNSSGQAVVCWQNGSFLGSAIQAAVNFSINPSPPLNLRGNQVKNRFVTQFNRVNVLNWDASTDSSVIKYFIYRNGVQIGTVSANSSLTYQDNNRSHQRTLYEVKAVNESNVESSPVSVYIQ